MYTLFIIRFWLYFCHLLSLPSPIHNTPWLQKFWADGMRGLAERWTGRVRAWYTWKGLVCQAGWHSWNCDEPRSSPLRSTARHADWQGSISQVSGDESTTASHREYPHRPKDKSHTPSQCHSHRKPSSSHFNPKPKYLMTALLISNGHIHIICCDTSI